MPTDTPTRHIIFLIIFTIVLFFGAPVGTASSFEGSGDLTIYVEDIDGDQVTDSLVTLDGQGKKTDKDGRVQFSDVAKDDSLDVTITAGGVSVTKQITFDTDGQQNTISLDRDIESSPKSDELATERFI